jgi:hypothetical protein
MEKIFVFLTIIILIGCDENQKTKINCDRIIESPVEKLFIGQKNNCLIKQEQQNK